MAFFGLTALGPQNSFEAFSTTFRYIQVFDDKDFTSAWKKVNGPESKYCSRSQLPKIFNVLFHGPVPGNEEKPLLDAFEEQRFRNTTSDDSISFDEYLTTMLKIKADAEAESFAHHAKSNPNCEFNSSSELSLALKKNAAMKRELQTKLTAPLTGMQEVLYFYEFIVINSVHLFVLLL